MLWLLRTFFCLSLLVNQAAPAYTQITGSVSVMWCWPDRILICSSSLGLYCTLKPINPFFLNLFIIFPSFWMEALSGRVPNFLALMHVSMCRKKKLAFQFNNIKHTLCASIVPQKNMLFYHPTGSAAFWDFSESLLLLINLNKSL